MRIKRIELRDRSACIPCLAIEISAADGYLAQRAGYGSSPCVLFGRMTGGEFSYDPSTWGDHVFSTAHRFLQENFDEVEDGQVVDVEVKENDTVHRSDQETHLRRRAAGA